MARIAAILQHIERDKKQLRFTMNWAKADNTLIKDLKDFTATFFQNRLF
jgi:type I restriction enzyme R subunit